MLFSGWRIDQKIIQVQKAGPTSEITQCYLHQALETSWLVPHFEGITLNWERLKGQVNTVLSMPGHLLGNKGVY